MAALVELVEHGKTKPAGTVVYKLPAAAPPVVTGAPRRHDPSRRAEPIGHRRRRVMRSIAVAGSWAAAQARGQRHEQALDFRVNHWADGMTRALGVKGGEWNREGQRSPDVEATYDLVAGKFVDQRPIANLFEQRKRFRRSPTRAASSDTCVPKAARYRSGSAPQAIELDQPFASYDPVEHRRRRLGVVHPQSIPSTRKPSRARRPIRNTSTVPRRHRREATRRRASSRRRPATGSASQRSVLADRAQHRLRARRPRSSFISSNSCRSSHAGMRVSSANTGHRCLGAWNRRRRRAFDRHESPDPIVAPRRDRAGLRRLAGRRSPAPSAASTQRRPSRHGRGRRISMATGSPTTSA